MYKQFTFSECISKANYYQGNAYYCYSRGLESTSSIYFMAAERHMHTAARWFELAQLASKGATITAKERPYNPPIARVS